MSENCEAEFARPLGLTASDADSLLRLRVADTPYESIAFIKTALLTNVSPFGRLAMHVAAVEKWLEREWVGNKEIRCEHGGAR